MNQLALVDHNGNMDNDMSHPMAPSSSGYDPKVTPMSIATISSGFEKGDFLVREEKGQRVVSVRFIIAIQMINFTQLMSVPSPQ
jgi:hypothetical protein